MKRRCAINLDHLITVPRSRLGRRVASVSETRLVEVAHAIVFALELDGLTRIAG